MKKSEKLKNVWIPVKEVSAGMFSNECAVSIILADGTEVSLFADKDLIENNGKGAFLKVTLIKKREKTVLLPSEAFETSTRWATVPELIFA